MSGEGEGVLFFEKTGHKLLLRIRISPNSSSCGVKGFYTDSSGAVFLKISVISVPEKGKANKELVAFLAKKLKFPKSSFEFVSGELDRYKKIMIAGDDAEIAVKNWMREEGIDYDGANN